jgi:hypothetical protein
MRFRLAAVESGVTHTPDVGVHVNLATDAVLLTNGGPLLHLLPDFKVLTHTWKKKRNEHPLTIIGITSPARRIMVDTLQIQTNTCSTS